MLHKEQAVTGRIFQTLPNFCPHRWIDMSKKARWIKKPRWTQKPHPIHTDSKYTIPDRLTRLTELIYKIGHLLHVFLTKLER
jgi:hypothetical protein